MEIRFETLSHILRSPQLQKTVAMALCIKSKAGRNSTVFNYNPNKIHELTGVSPSTFKYYLPLMEQMGLVHYAGAKNQHLVINCLKSSHKERNIKLEGMCMESFKEIYNTLRAYILLFIQRRKDYIKQLLQIAFNPLRSQIERCKGARKKVRNYVRKGILRNTECKENGISLKYIANAVGCCVKTAQKVVGFAVSHGLCTKHKNFERVKLPCVCYREVDGYTFTTMNYGYIIHANTYSLTAAANSSFGGGENRW